ncbi:MAG: hypothetical protein Q7T82_17045 [Armatimonadota bacterium]|nr:hypothetical protein [Armatimonadota bacterium]
MSRYTNRLWSENERGDILLKENIFDVFTGRSSCREITILADGERKESNHVIRLYTYNEIEKMLISAGLKVESVYGDFDSSPFTLASRRMMVIAQKPEG